MSLYKRGDTWHYDFAIAGGRYRGSTKETVLSRARQVEALLMAQANGRGHSVLPRKAPVLREFAGRFLQWVEASLLEPESKNYYRSGWRMVEQTVIAGMRLDHITTDAVETVRFGGSPANANRALRTLRRMLSKAAEWGLLQAAPRIKLMKEYGRSTLMDAATESKLLAVAIQPLRDVLLIMLDTGMRPQEVFRMRWENVNWEARTIFVPYGKTRNSRRYVPLSERVAEALQARSKGKTEGWVFPSCRSASGHLTSVAKAFAEARRATEINPSVVLYCARHTFATQALAATGNLAAVMRALGHCNAQTAMIYQHPSIDAIREAVDKRNLIAAQRHKHVTMPSLVQ